MKATSQLAISGRKAAESKYTRVKRKAQIMKVGLEWIAEIVSRETISVMKSKFN